MAIDSGEQWTGGDAPGALVLTLTSDGSGTKGEAVKFNGSNQVTPTTANGDPIVGVLQEDSPSSGSDVEVAVWGPVNMTADGSISEGDLLQPSGSTNGHVVAAASNEGLVTAVDEGGTDTYDIYSKYAQCLEKGGSVADGDVFRAWLG